MMVLGLDQAPRHTGFAFGESRLGVVPTWGVKDFDEYGENEQFLILSFLKWFRPLLDEVKPDVVYFEQVLLSRPPNFRVFYQQAAIVAAIMVETALRGIDAWQIDIATWRKRALGKSNKPKWAATGEEDWLKEAAKLACADRNWLIEDHNAAEAALIWEYGCAHADREYMAASKPRVARVLMERENKDRAFGGKPA